MGISVDDDNSGCSAGAIRTLFPTRRESCRQAAGCPFSAGRHFARRRDVKRSRPRDHCDGRTRVAVKK
jgi:hypothetical protein